MATLAAVALLLYSLNDPVSPPEAALQATMRDDPADYAGRLRDE
jgi:hypothetical protein